MSAEQRNVTCPAGANRFDQKYTVKTGKFSAGVMVWASYSGEKGVGGLYFLDKNMNMDSTLYVNVLNDHMFPFYESHDSAHFLQDDAPGYRAKKVKEWLAQHRIQLVEWLGHSPNLNAIEHVWNQMKRKLGKLPISSVDALIKKIREHWNEMDSSY